MVQRWRKVTLQLPLLTVPLLTARPQAESGGTGAAMLAKDSPTGRLLTTLLMEQADEAATTRPSDQLGRRPLDVSDNSRAWNHMLDDNVDRHICESPETPSLRNLRLFASRTADQHLAPAMFAFDLNERLDLA